ncbi:MAG: hypothetical protein GEU97_23590 [Actinophytocola sp.]|nr:hypothetical protein [Actinophytocola sp.]
MLKKPLLAVFTVMLLTSVAVATGPPSMRAAAETVQSDRPGRVLILVVDAFRPDYVERFNMVNARSLMSEGATFPAAIVGHMAAETVTGHNVMTSGLFPKHMGWSNEVFRDVDNVLGEGRGAYFVTSSLSCDQFRELTLAGGYPKLADYLDTAFPDGKFVAIGQKPTAACPAGQPADPDDIVITFGGRNFDCDGDGTANWRGPTGENVPAYIAEPVCGRYYVDSDSNLDYGTASTAPAWMYPLDGNRFVPGYDPAHLGGDVWAADAAIDVMRNEPDWRGMLVSLADVDKAGHMWGPDDPGPTGSTDPQAHLEFAVKTADAQLGKILGALTAHGVDDETLVILTGDHAIQQAVRHHGIDEASRGNFNWYYGQDSDETYLSPSPALQPVVDTGNADFLYQDGHMAAWLSDTSKGALRQAATVMRTLPDVIATYYREQSRYRLAWAGGNMSAPERTWWAQHRQLVDTMAAPYGPDVVGLLRDRTSYGVAGDHGGHQKEIQQIPMVFAGPGIVAGSRPGVEARQVDLLPTILDLFQLSHDPAHRLDGTALPVR